MKTKIALILIAIGVSLHFDTVYAAQINYGDVIGAGYVSIYDAELTAQYSIGLPVANFNTAAAEVDGTNTVNIYDAFLIAEYAIGLIQKFPVQGLVANGNVSEEEFVGPFADWINVKTAFGATGNGVTDDTVAIQNALNALSPTTPTLYFPPGTYLISQTLNLTGQIHVNLIGADPATTTILWNGASGSNMLCFNGVAYSRFDRLTFNGQGIAGVAIDQSWAGTTAQKNYFDTNNQYADDVFENVGYGFLCGALGYGCAETSMLRDHFLNNTVAGVFMANYNALDMWVWYSIFQNDAIGVANSVNAPNGNGAGDFNVYNSIFKNSTFADISIGNTDPFNIRNNYSIDSNMFISTAGTGNPAPMIVEGNTILDTTDFESIYVGNEGPVLLIDNVVRGLPSASNLVAHVNNWNPSDLFSFNNTFTTCTNGLFGIIPCTIPVASSGHFHSINDQVVNRNTINPSLPILPGTPPNNNRQIFEVTPGSSAAQIQLAINNAFAAQSTSDKPVVHLQAGNYSINQTLVVPANSDMQIIGDGAYSQLNWSGTGTGPVLQLLGPSQATLREFQVNGNGNKANGIELDNVDQPGSRVFMQGAVLTSPSNTNIFVDALDYTNVELHDFTHYSDAGTGMTSVNVTGGPSAAEGAWLGSMTNIFAGVSYGNYNDYAVSNSGHLEVLDTWNDNGDGGTELATVMGASTFTYAGSMGAQPSSDTVAVSLNNFTGTAALLDLLLNQESGNIEMTGSDANAQVLGLGLVGPSSNFFLNTSSPAAATEFLNSSESVVVTGGAITTELSENPTTPNTAFMTATLNQMRTDQPAVPEELPNGVTDVRIYRVYVENAINSIHLKAASSS